MKNNSQLSHLKEKIISGDYTAVADITGFSAQYVRMVMDGIRNNKTIVQAMVEYLKSRENLKDKYHGEKEGDHE